MQKTLFLNFYQFLCAEKTQTDTHETREQIFPQLEKKSIFEFFSTLFGRVIEKGSFR